MLVHGIGSELCVWEPVLERLSAERDVIAVDLPGFGHSEPLPAHIPPTPAMLAWSVTKLAIELDAGPVHVAGNSLGGWVALEMARPTGPAASRA